MKKVLVNLVTHSSYRDVCEDFLKLYKKNWKNNYDFIISIIGDKFELEDYKCLYHGKHTSLPGAIYKTMKDNDYDYCISFLGDAFIYKRIDNDLIEDFINTIYNQKIEYCSLVPHYKLRFAKKRINSYARYITNTDSYNINFVAFIASKEFIMNEFKNNISDLEFEKKYLKSSSEKEFTYDNRAILTKNIFNITSGINAGKWNRHSLKRIKSNNGDITLNNRERLSVKEQVKSDMVKVLQMVLSRKKIVFLKRVCKKIFKIKSVTDY